MPQGPKFDPSLYRGTAEFYEEFRKPYPETIHNFLRTEVPVGPHSRALDLACGTGQLAFGLAAGVGEVWAVDQEPEFVALGQRKSVDLGYDNMRWIVAPAESVALVGQFDLVVVGNAFHRLDRPAVAQRLVPHLSRGGCVALLWSWSPWQGDRPWQRALSAALDHWMQELAAQRRVAENWQRTIDHTPHSKVLQQAGLAFEGRHEFPTTERWTTPELIGHLYSTSLLSQPVVGTRRAEFERDVTNRLLSCNPNGVFAQHQTYAVDLARLPGF